MLDGNGSASGPRNGRGYALAIGGAIVVWVLYSVGILVALLITGLVLSVLPGMLRLPVFVAAMIIIIVVANRFWGRPPRMY
jgi:hypothetical protein